MVSRYTFPLVYYRTMCCTFRPARLTDTTLYAGEHRHPLFLERVHVLGYQNTAQNLFSGPNAMILPFPTHTPMGPENILDTSKTPHILKDMAKAIQIHTASFSRGEPRLASAGARRSVQVFESGKYTVVLADDPRDIKGALGQVSQDRRPEVNPEIMAAYAEWYPKWPVALCCFNAKEMHPADPLLWWYMPANAERLFLPALDAHDGHKPNLNAMVDVDHTVLAGTSITPRDFNAWSEHGASVHYTENIPDELTHFVPDRVIGAEYRRAKEKNGDFYIATDELGSFSLSTGRASSGSKATRGTPHGSSLHTF